MSAKSASDISDIVRVHCERAGIVISSIEVLPYGNPPFDEIPIARGYVPLASSSASEIYNAMKRLESSLSQECGASLRTGFYSADLGYEDIPDDMAMIEIDGFPFALAKSASLAP